MNAAPRSLWLLAALTLAVGAATYVWLRPQPVWLLPAAWHAPIDATWPAVPTGSLPTFLHALAFVVLTAVVARPAGPRHVVGLAISWLAIEAGFECIQHPAVAPVAGAALSVLPFGDGLARFAQMGTFDPADIGGAAFGVLLGAIVVLRVLSPSGRSNGASHGT